MKLRVWAVPCGGRPCSCSPGVTSSRPGPPRSSTAPRSPTHEVQDVADAQCVAADEAAQGRRRHAPRALSRIHQQSLYLLIDAELSRQYAEEEGLERVAGPGGRLLQRVRATRSPRCRRSPAPCSRTCSRDWAESRAVLVAGRQRGHRPGAERSRTSSSCSTPGCRSGQQWMKTADIETDPRYAPGEDGLPGGGDTSVSEPGSDFAKDAGARGGRPRVGRRASGQPEVRLRTWRAHRTTSESASADRPRRPSCPR